MQNALIHGPIVFWCLHDDCIYGSTTHYDTQAELDDHARAAHLPQTYDDSERSPESLSQELITGRGFVVLPGYLNADVCALSSSSSSSLSFPTPLGSERSESLEQAAHALQAAIDRCSSRDQGEPRAPPKRLWDLLHDDLFLSLAQPRGTLDAMLGRVLGPKYLLAGCYSNSIYSSRAEGQMHVDYPYSVLATVKTGTGSLHELTTKCVKSTKSMHSSSKGTTKAAPGGGNGNSNGGTCGEGGTSSDGGTRSDSGGGSCGSGGGGGGGKKRKKEGGDGGGFGADGAEGAYTNADAERSEQEHLRHTPLGEATVQGVTTILAVDDFTGESGATWIVPGSQRTFGNGLVACSSRTVWPADKAEVGAVQLICPPGSLIVLHCGCLHWSGANRTANQPRRAVLSMYLRACVRPQVDPWLSLPAHVRGSAGKRTRALLGAHWHEFSAVADQKRRKHEDGGGGSGGGSDDSGDSGGSGGSRGHAGGVGVGGEEAEHDRTSRTT